MRRGAVRDQLMSEHVSSGENVNIFLNVMGNHWRTSSRWVSGTDSILKESFGKDRLVDTYVWGVVLLENKRPFERRLQCSGLDMLLAWT